MKNLTTLLVVVAMLTSMVSLPGAAESTGDWVKMTDVRVEMDDGVELATDIYVPTQPDRDGDGLYPCVVELTPYRKESRASEGRDFLPAAGIALIEVDARGTGGSEGEYDIVFSVREQADTAHMIDWAAEEAVGPDGQPLCEQEVGMYGGSYSGIIQYLVASLPDQASEDLPAAPEHLSTIAPQRAYGDLYRDIVYHGGMVIGSFGVIWSQGTSALYYQPPTDIATEDGQQAWADHLTKNDPMILPYLNNQYSDARWCSDDSASGYCQDLYEDSSILPRIENLEVPTLHLAGWYDSFTRGQLLTFQEAHAQEQAEPDQRGPNFLIVGPWNHGGTHFLRPDQGFQDELIQWYQYWLEDAADGQPAPAWIQDGFEPEVADGTTDRVRYFQMRSTTINPDPANYPEHGEWRTAPTWPVPGTDMQRLYLNQGTLQAEAPETFGFDAYTTYPAAGAAETLSRWDNAAGTPHPRFDQRAETASGLTYTTGPLEEDLQVTGPIAMTLHMATIGVPGPQPSITWPSLAQLVPPYHDTDVIVKVSDVAPDGTAHLITQGYLRASHQAVDEAKSTTIDGELVSPYHPHTAEALETSLLPGQIQELNVEIWPTAKTFPQGHELRIDVMSADTPNHLTLLKPATNLVYHGGATSSYIALPTSG